MKKTKLILVLLAIMAVPLTFAGCKSQDQNSSSGSQGRQMYIAEQSESTITCNK